MPRRYPAETRRQVIELARAGTKVAQLATTFGMTEATSTTGCATEGIRRSGRRAVRAKASAADVVARRHVVNGCDHTNANGSPSGNTAR
jgi:hypothetical protein